MADFDIGSLLNSLSPQDIENIKSVAADFLGNSKSPEKDTPKPQTTASLPDLSTLSNLNMPDLSQISALLPILNAFNSHDSRIDFIEALKPLLSEGKRQKADEAMKLVRLMSVIPLLRERGIM